MIWGRSASQSNCFVATESLDWGGAVSAGETAITNLTLTSPAGAQAAHIYRPEGSGRP